MPTRIPVGSFSLWFLGLQEPALERTSFSYDPELGEIVAVRGRVHGAHYSSNCFLWSPAVRALTVLLLRTASAAGGEPPSIAGEDGSLASSLDYAVSKSPDWIVDMFGSRADGSPYSRALIQRSNPERKRPGPVTITINNRMLPGDRIKVFLDNVQVSNPGDLSSLADRIEGTEAAAPAKQVSAVPEGTRSAGKQTSAIFDRIEAVPCHYFLNSLDLDREFLRCMRRRVLDRKFAFTAPGTGLAWRDLVTSETYQYFRESLELVDRISPRIAEHTGEESTLIAVWPGTGDKEARLALQFSSSNKPSIYLVDTSQEMLNLSANKILSSGLTAECYFADFMQTGVLPAVCERARIPGMPNILIFFGHTLGTHPQAELLQNVRAALQSIDFVIFGVHSRPDGEALDEPALRERFFKQYGNTYFENQLLRAFAPAGIRPSMGKMEFELTHDKFFPDLMVVEQYFRFNNAHVARFAGEELPFAQGERIFIGFYYQYTRAVIENILLSQGFRIVEVFASAGGALEILCQRR